MNIIAGVPDDEELFLKLGIAKYVPTEGSKRVKCSECHKYMWLGPKQLEMQAKGETQSLCMICAASVLAEGKSQYDVKPLGEKGGTYIPIGLN